MSYEKEKVNRYNSNMIIARLSLYLYFYFPFKKWKNQHIKQM